MKDFCVIGLIFLGLFVFFVLFAVANEIYYTKPGHRLEAVLDLFANFHPFSW